MLVVPRKIRMGFDNRNIRVLFMLIISTLVSLVVVLLYAATEFE